MTTAHTPGPWRVSELGRWVGEPRFVIVAPDKSGQRHSRMDRSGAFEAPDAALIAAAPDMLIALQIFEHAMESGMVDNDLHGALSAARAAISKATGEPA